MAIPAGAFNSVPSNKCTGGTPIRMYAARVEPATLEKPPTIRQCNCEGVSLPMMGRTRRGASVCPSITFATAQTASALLVPKR